LRFPILAISAPPLSSQLDRTRQRTPSHDPHGSNVDVVIPGSLVRASATDTIRYDTRD